MDEPASPAATADPDLSRLPQLDVLLARDDAAGPIAEFGRTPFAAAARAVLDDVRAGAGRRRGVPGAGEVVARAAAALERHRSRRLTRVVNATGVVLHTNLGRAPLSAAARAAVADAAGYTTLEYDRDTGGRGARTGHVGELLAELCATEAAAVVNNGAAALVLVLAALSTGRETVVSRGELIEIGGSYRLPDVMAVSGARMREVGTTNRTRVADYRAAVGDDTAVLLKVHPSNYQVVGFTQSVPADELAALSREARVPFVYDLGSGLLGDQEGPLAGEPSVAEAVRSGADLVIFSGDKLLGGPQAGIISGRADLVLRCTRHPLARALRIDKLARAALEATVEAHLRADAAVGPLDVPTWAMLQADPRALRERAEAAATAIGDVATAEPSAALVGGGSLPGAELASWCLALTGHAPEALAASLRAQDPPVVGRVEGGRVLLDLRTVPPTLDADLVALVRSALDQATTGR